MKLKKEKMYLLIGAIGVFIAEYGFINCGIHQSIRKCNDALNKEIDNEK